MKIYVHVELPQRLESMPSIRPTKHQRPARDSPFTSWRRSFPSVSMSILEPCVSATAAMVLMSETAEASRQVWLHAWYLRHDQLPHSLQAQWLQ